MTEDDDKEVVAQACMSVADIMNDFGYIAVEPCKSWNYLAVCFIESCACVFCCKETYSPFFLFPTFQL